MGPDFTPRGRKRSCDREFQLSHLQRACSLPCALSDFPFLLGTKVQPCLQVTSKVTPPSLSRQPLSRAGHKKPHCWDSGPPPPPVLSQAYERLWCACMSIRMFTLQCAGANAHRSEANIEGVSSIALSSTRLGRFFFFQLNQELSDMVVSLASSLQGAPISPFPGWRITQPRV